MFKLLNKLFRLFTVFFPLFAFSQAPEAKDVLFSPFFAEKNLSSRNITCFFQDHNGYMWIGTEDGLNFFNGKTIHVFKHDRLDKNSLTDNLIGSICEDQQGSIWIGTAYGISKLNPDKRTFENYTKDGQGKGLDYKMKVYVDRENNIWAFSSNVFKFQSSKNYFSNISFKVSDKFYSGLFQDSKKRYWLSSDENLYRFYPKENRKEAFCTLNKKTYFFNVTEDPAGNLFCGTWDDGLFKLNPEKEKFDTIEAGGLKGTYAFQVFGKETLFWYGNWLKSYNLQSNKKYIYENKEGLPYSKRNDEIAALFADRQNQLWIGYATQGIQIVSPSNQAFKTYKLSGSKETFPVVNCFVKTKHFAYAGGWYNYSLAKLDSNNKPVKIWKTILSNVKQKENNISDAWDDRQGNVWFTTAFGLAKFNETTEKTELYHLDSSVTRRSFFLRMLPEGDSVLWLSGYFCGLSRFSIKTKTFQNWGADVRSLYWDITRDWNGIIWLADNSGILTGFNPASKTFITKNYNNLTEGVIYHSITFDKIHNALWIGSTNGLLRVNTLNFEAKLFTEKDNLPTSQINGVQLDSQSRLWIATSKGLCFYDQDQNIFRTFFSNAGLPGDNLDQLFRIQNNGDLYIGCPNGFSVLKTAVVNITEASQPVIINKLFESGRIIPFELKEALKIVHLNHDENNIQIEFSSADLVNSEDNQLLYRLGGKKESWLTSPTGIINFSKLSPGQYSLEVSAINHNGSRSTQTDHLILIIHPPYWKQTWFIILISALIISLVIFSARYVFTRNLREKILILEKEQAIEKERTRISQDMHDDLGSGLTKISILSEVAKTQLNDRDKAKTQLENISSSSRELVDNLQDIIWILNSKNDSLENLCAYLREFSLKYFESTDILLNISFPEKLPDLKLSEDQRRNTLLVFKETFNNCNKHSDCSRIDISMELEQKKIIFRIKDNGKGFEKRSIRHFANGLQNMEKRMKDIKGTYNISSSPGSGTSSIFMFES